MKGGLPIGLAAVAGVFAAVNPCGFAMLPSFVAAYLGIEEHRANPKPIGRRVVEGLAVGGAVTLGFMVVFAAIGVVVSLGGTFVARQFPTIVLILGALLLAIGVWLAAGRTLPVTVPVPGRASSRRGLPGAVLYGGLYGLASLGCTLPVFLVVVGSAFAAGSLVPGVALFIAYSAGMGLVVTGVAVAAALLKAALARTLRRALPFVRRASGGLLCAAGAYLILRELNQPRVGQASWIRALADHPGAVALGAVGAAGLGALLIGLASMAGARSGSDVAEARR